MKANEVCGKQDFLSLLTVQGENGTRTVWWDDKDPQISAAKFVMLKKYRMYYRNAKICQNCFTGLL